MYRRLAEAGISTDDRTQLSEGELDDTIRSLKYNHPNDGEVLIQGQLLSMGVRVPRQALRDSIHRVDHQNVASRRHSVVRRRVYSVPFPNSVWHIDSHHKMVRWRFIVHGAIDGFSRTVIYLRCFDNNQASTVLDLFVEGVSQFGLPDRVRSDCGGGNVDVWRFMISTHHRDFSSVITGSSVHNERVERLWRDVHRCVASVFADSFRMLERENKLDPLNEVDLFCLHYVFSPRINKCLLEFQQGWNQHSLSSEGHKTPLQLMFEGFTHPQYETASVNVNNMDVDISQLLGDHVTVPRCRFSPCASLVQEMNSIDPLQPCSDNGISLYVRAIEMCGSHLRSLCHQCSVL